MGVRTGLCAVGMGLVWDGGYVWIGLGMALAFGVCCLECQSRVLSDRAALALREEGAVYAMA